MLPAPSYYDSDISESYHKHMFLWPSVLVDKIMKKLKQLNHGKDCAEDGIFDQMVDVGCGNGQSTRVFSPYFRSILGCDVSKEQIQRAEAENSLENVRFMVGPGESLLVGDETVDLLTSASAFHYLDTRKSLVEFRRVLKPHGCVALFSNDYKDVVLDHEFHEIQVKSGIHIFREFYHQHLKRFISRVDHPTKRSYDRMKKIYEDISEFEKSRVDDIGFDWCITMEHFRAYEKNMPANRSLENEIVGKPYPLDSGLEKLKEFWEVEELAESDIHLRINMTVFLILLNKIQKMDNKIPPQRKS